MRNSVLAFLLCLQITNIRPTNSPNALGCAPWDTTCLATLSPRHQTPSPRVFDSLIIEPLELDFYKLEKDGMVFETRNTKVNGLKDTVMQELRADPNTNTIHMKLFTPELLVTGLYRANGSLFMLPIDGEGDYMASFKNMVIDATAPFKVIQNAYGQYIMEASNFKMALDVTDNAEYRLNNLHYGFRGFSDVIQFVANYNWKYVTSNYVTPFIVNAAERRANVHKAYFSLEPFRFLYCV